MVKENPYLDEFFENTKRTRDEILSNRKLTNSICVALGSKKMFPEAFLEKIKGYLEEIKGRGIPVIIGTSQEYLPLIPEKYALKRRDPKQSFPLGKIEVVVTADLYTPQLPISPFAVPIIDEGIFWAYVVQDFGHVTELRDLRKLHLVEGDAHLMKRKAQNLATVLGEAKGYHFLDDYWNERQPRCIALNPHSDLVIHDLSCFGTTSVYDFIDIVDGVKGKGKFSRLK